MSSPSVLLHACDVVRPGGGPAGYLWNLKTWLGGHPEAKGAIAVAGLREHAARTHDETGSDLAARWFDNVMPLLPPVARDAAWTVRWRRRIAALARRSRQVFGDELSQYGAVAFHDPLLFAVQRLAPYQTAKPGVVVYMQHSPTSFADEIVQTLPGLPSWGRTFELLHAIECDNFGRADVVLLPCPEAVEDYERFPRLREALRRVRVEILPTGILDPASQVPVDRRGLRRTLGMPEEAFVGGFFGRYHPHKGFDVFVEVVASMTAENVQFICCGRGPLRAPRLPNLIDLGWRTDVLALMGAVDAVVMPNRATFFDIAALEAMALGRPLLISAVGGTRALARTSAGVMAVPSPFVDQGVALLRALAQDRKACAALGRENRRAYEAEFTLDHFGRRHLDLSRRLLGSPVGATSV